MTTITKERLLTIKQWRETYGPGSNVVLPAEEAEELARIVLASLEAEPVAWLLSGGGAKNNVSFDSGNAYADPPAPVSVPAAMEIDDDFDSAFEHGKAVGWNAYRAAMLQAEPVSNSDELPLDYLQGHKDGLEWAAQLAEANHPQTGDWLYDDPIDLARAIRKGPDMPTVQAGNYPVTPDGWISCSDLMPEDTKMLLAFSQGEIVAAYWNWVVNPIDYKKYRAFTYLSGNILDDVTHWMPLPEPPQEAK
ncbi:TPA: DUF551 domain-containing protein [Escherichia coli]